MALAGSGRARHFTWHPEHLPAAATAVVDTTRERYPELRVPYHSRWRHFEVGGLDRWGQLAGRAGLTDTAAARAQIDLVIPSVLLDAGAGPDWRWVEGATGMALQRSEGLGVASLHMFAAGAFSTRPDDPLRSDAEALRTVTEARLAEGFQAGPDNLLVGMPGRAALLTRLGQAAAAAPEVFGEPARLGNLLDFLTARAERGRVRAAVILETILHTLGPVWPGRLVRDGVPLGDCWPHPDAPGGLVPFHKLSQWLTYSLLEPLETAGLKVTGLDELTGLPEYRNGGLLLDTGVLQPRDRSFFTRPLPVDDEAVVEWRALTVIALDSLADMVRTRLGLDGEAFPLARVLEGGTWAAGRRIAAQLRPGGPPPVNVISDGTVF